MVGVCGKGTEAFGQSKENLCPLRLTPYGGFVVVVYFILSRLLYLAFSANLGLLCMPHPGMGPLV